MLSQKTIDRLNQQINLEIYSSHLYLQMSSWCAYQSLDGCAAFLSQHADEEMMHMRRLLNYLQETGALATINPCNFCSGMSPNNIKKSFYLKAFSIKSN